MKLNAISERIILLGTHGTNFASRLVSHLQKIISTQVEAIAVDDLKKTISHYDQLALQVNESLWEDLIPYRGLILWLKEMDARKYSEAQMVSLVLKCLFSSHSFMFIL